MTARSMRPLRHPAGLGMHVADVGLLEANNEPGNAHTVWVEEQASRRKQPTHLPRKKPAAQALTIN
jgi:hypothetical protein